MIIGFLIGVISGMVSRNLEMEGMVVEKDFMVGVDQRNQVICRGNLHTGVSARNLASDVKIVAAN